MNNNENRAIQSSPTDSTEADPAEGRETAQDATSENQPSRADATAETGGSPGHAPSTSTEAGDEQESAGDTVYIVPRHGGDGSRRHVHLHEDCQHVQRATHYREATRASVREDQLCRHCTGDHEPQGVPEGVDPNATRKQLAEMDPDDVGLSELGEREDDDRELVTDGGQILACPECDAAGIRSKNPSHPRSTGDDREYICDSCGATFDEPRERERERTGSRNGLARELEKIGEDDDRELVTDGGAEYWIVSTAGHTTDRKLHTDRNCPRLTRALDVRPVAPGEHQGKEVCRYCQGDPPSATGPTEIHDAALEADADDVLPDGGVITEVDSDRPWQDPDVLARLYHGQELTTREIAARLGCTNGTISRWLDNHDIEARENWTAGVEAAKRANRVERVKLRTLETGYEYWGSSEWRPGEDSRTTEIVYVHRLLAVAEYGFDAVADRDVHHKDGIPWHNQPDNIELIDPEEHGRRHSLEYHHGQGGDSE